MDLRELTNNATESPFSSELLEPPVSDHENEDYANTSQLNSDALQSEINSEKMQSELLEKEQVRPLKKSIVLEASSPFLGPDDGDVTQSDLELEQRKESVSKSIPSSTLVIFNDSKNIAAAQVDLDDASDSQTCQWNSCSSILKNLHDLTAHIEEEHLTNTPKSHKCLWNSCNENLHSNSDLIEHIRTHTNYTPFICPAINCDATVHSSDDFLKHFITSHPEEDSFESKQTYIKWVKFLDNFHTQKKISTTLPLKRDFSKYANLDNDSQFLAILHKPKIDFQKLQNVGVEDLVTEPVRKKGRTATAEINASIREPFLWEDRQYKKFVASQSKYLFEKEDVERIIDSENPDHIHNVDELKELEAKLKRKEAWSREVSAILQKDLEKLQKEEEKLWFMKEALLQINLELELPDNASLYTLK